MNPTRTLGVGVFDFLVTSRGLWVASEESTIVKRSYTPGTVGPAMTVPTGGVRWNQVRGALMLNGQM